MRGSLAPCRLTTLNKQVGATAAAAHTSDARSALPPALALATAADDAAASSARRASTASSCVITVTRVGSISS